MSQGSGIGRVGSPVGGKPVGTFWRVFFWAAWVFSLILGLLGMLSPEANLDARIIGLLVFAFGVIYLLVAHDPLRFAAALCAGVIA